MTIPNNRGSHTFSNEPNFFENEKVVREKGNQWGVFAHEGGVTPVLIWQAWRMKIEEWVYQLVLD